MSSTSNPVAAQELKSPYVSSVGSGTVLPKFKTEEKFELYQTPHPSYTPPQAQAFPGSQENVVLECDKMPAASRYPLMISAIVPRPIALVTSQSEAGINNCSPFSYFNVICHDPPTLIVSCNYNRDGTAKDSLRNILTTKDFVVSIMSEWYIESSNYTCGNFKYGDDEMKAAGMEVHPSKLINPPTPAASAFSMECRLESTYDLKSEDGSGRMSTTMVIARILAFCIKKDVLKEDGTLDMEKYAPIARLGGIQYGRVTQGFELPRPYFKH
ncbi:hypothetical protein SmJEL517_g06184 [Synchytrium microbalum]|uniref:Flavin reductase like domain-containing protein n=1 Tax=Synchytrium microbalum TaxID=1806994 RepID=A0A507BWI3_9FUNG|nr:uncharacterized protein SmJEL517_g06184 [Synchytrium microbalum]TPX30194.1 hypothetical protein SmJEL517_g06184 [Synchytrium microbalum]